MITAPLFAAASCLLLVLQIPSPSPTPAPPQKDYAIGSGDVLDVSVIGNEEMTRTTTVQPSGTITLPLLGEVPVAGLTVSEVQKKLTTLLERDFLVNPQVEVKVREFQSQFVIVLGEINSPGRKPLRGKTRLIDLLVDAGGFKPNASGDVTITRREGTFEGGGDTMHLRIGSGAMSPLDRVNLEVPLRDGDMINVAAKQQVTIEGEIARPGRYTIDGETTVTAAISQAGGLTRFGSDDVKIRRINHETGKVEILEVDLKSIRNGRKTDVILQPNDVVTVPRRRF